MPLTSPQPAPLPPKGALTSFGGSEQAKNDSRAIVAAQLLSQTADKLSILSLFSLIILFGPKGELLGLSSILLLLPAIMFSMPAGIWADRKNPAALMRHATLLRAAIIFLVVALLPQLIEDQERGLFIALAISLVGAASSVFDVCRLNLIPNLVPDQARKSVLRSSIKLNSLCWAAFAGSMMIATAIWLSTDTAMPWMLLKASVLLYVGAFFAIASVNSGSQIAVTNLSRTRNILSLGKFSKYLKSHARARKTLLVSAGVGTFTLAFSVCLTLFAYQSHRLSLQMMMDLVPALALGMMAGAIAANFAVKKPGLTKLTEGIAPQLAIAAIASAVVAYTGHLVIAQFGIFVLGAVASHSQTLLDTLLQRLFPSGVRGRALGLRATLQLLPLLAVCVYIERILPAVSLLPVLRVISVTAIIFAVITAFIWNDLIFLLARQCARILLKALFRFQIVDHSQDHDMAEEIGSVTKSGIEKWGRRKTVILAGNHTGWLDALIVGSIFDRRTRFLVMEEALGWPLLGPLARRLGAIPLKRGKGNLALDQAKNSLAHGESVLIFPEGRLTKDGNLGEFQSGVARLHKLTGCPIIPFAISGGFEAWPKGRKLPHLVPVKISIGKPIDKDATTNLDIDGILHTLRENIESLKTESKK